MFPSIPPKDTSILVKKLLFATNTNPLIINDILCLLTVCLKQNYFQFQNKIYSCSKGLIMGNPLSPLLAKIFMNNLENIFPNTFCLQNVFTGIGVLMTF